MNHSYYNQPPDDPTSYHDPNHEPDVPELETPEVPNSTQAWYIVLAWIGGIIIVGILSAMIGYMIVAPEDITPQTEALILLLSPILSNGLIILLLVYFIRRQRFNHRKTLRLNSVPLGIYVWTIAGVLGLGIIVDEIGHQLYPYIGELIDTSILLYIQKMVKEVNFVTFIMMFISISILPGVCEELMVRGYIQKGFEQNYSPVVAIFLSSLIFGVMHGDIIQGGMAFFLALFMASVAYRFDSILPLIFAHIVNNGFSLLSARFTDVEIEQLPLQSYPAQVIVFAFIAFGAAIYMIFYHQSKTDRYDSNMVG